MTRHIFGKFQFVSGDEQSVLQTSKERKNRLHTKDQKSEWLQTSHQQQQHQKLENNEECPQISENSISSYKPLII